MKFFAAISFFLIFFVFQDKKLFSKNDFLEHRLEFFSDDFLKKMDRFLVYYNLETSYENRKLFAEHTYDVFKENVIDEDFPKKLFERLKDVALFLTRYRQIEKDADVEGNALSKIFTKKILILSVACLCFYFVTKKFLSRREPAWEVMPLEEEQQAAGGFNPLLFHNTQMHGLVHGAPVHELVHGAPDDWLEARGYRVPAMVRRHHLPVRQDLMAIDGIGQDDVAELQEDSAGGFRRFFLNIFSGLLSEFLRVRVGSDIEDDVESFDLDEDDDDIVRFEGDFVSRCCDDPWI